MTLSQKMNRFFVYIAIIFASLFQAAEASAVESRPENTGKRFADHSVLSEGRWARVRVKNTGMHLIPDATIRSLGFSDPSKVHVYGTGGYEIDFSLNASTPDDLPLQPSVRAQKGIVFFAAGNVRWMTNKMASDASNVPYMHRVNSYTDDSFYFLSDREVADEKITNAAASPCFTHNGNALFMERLLHEQELVCPGESGAIWLGEDFRTKKSQTFPFSLTGIVGKDAKMRVRFGARTAGGGGAYIMLSANGNRLPSTEFDKIPVPTLSTNPFVTMANTGKSLEGVGNSLNVGIDFSYTGTLFQARLDYIEVFYPKALQLINDELYFYGTFKPGTPLTLSGCSDKTIIWDVTDPNRPQLVNYASSESKASFYVEYEGYREYMAFDPEKVSRTVEAAGNVGSVANQDIHAMEIPDMVIITLPEYIEASRRLAALHERVDSMRVHVLTPDAIYNEFSGGKPDVSAFRRMLKMWYHRGQESPDADHKLRYCIIMGKPTYDNRAIQLKPSAIGYNPMIIYQSKHHDKGDVAESGSFSTDDIIAMLDDSYDETFSMDYATIHLAVGRIPCTSAKEAGIAVDKIESYVEHPVYGSWRSRIQLIADDDDSNSHFDDSQGFYGFIRSQCNGSSFVYDRVYLDSYRRVQTAVGDSYPQATARMLKNYNDGVMLTNYVGHGAPTSWGHEHLWTWPDIQAMHNPNLPFIYASTCGFNYWDLPTQGASEVLVLNPEGGAIAMVSASRTSFVSPNRILNQAWGKIFFTRGEDGKARRFGDVLVMAKNISTSANDHRYCCVGDPAIRIPSPDYDVKIKRIGNVDVSKDDGAMAEVAAMQSVEVEGVITPLGSGEISAAFDGTIALQLFDAERVINTFGQGVSGIPTSYNDRNIRLSTSTAVVEGGKFKATLRVPPEITGNYTPAMIAAYASDGKGLEANGVSERLYVYGYDESLATDTVGPDIEKMYVNYEGNSASALVASNSILFVHLRDDSGINISEGGIGHSLTLTIDGKDIRSDLADYFVQDPSDSSFGTITYPLNGLPGGRHTLSLTAWDNANNSSTASIDINVGAAFDPTIIDLRTDVNPASEAVKFILTLDRPNTRFDCTIGVYTLDGRKVWESQRSTTSDSQGRIITPWDLRDGSGARVSRGIYIYRATVETQEGTYSSRSQRLAVTAQ